MLQKGALSRGLATTAERQEHHALHGAGENIREAGRPDRGGTILQAERKAAGKDAERNADILSEQHRQLLLQDQELSQGTKLLQAHGETRGRSRRRRRIQHGAMPHQHGRRIPQPGRLGQGGAVSGVGGTVLQERKRGSGHILFQLDKNRHSAQEEEVRRYKEDSRQ